MEKSSSSSSISAEEVSVLSQMAEKRPPAPSNPPRPLPPLPAGGLQHLASDGSVVLDPPAGLVTSSTESRSATKLPSSKYKGVVPQPNGRWGAQIYEKHQRVWLGTFNDEVEAAKAYDIAVQRFRGRDAVTNFKPLHESGGDVDAAAEIRFLNSNSKAEIVDMLRKHTYDDELLQSRRSLRSALHPWASGGGGGGGGLHGRSSPPASPREQLFEKSVTPSDVGKLNRLVIPKQHAEKHFPLLIGTNGSTLAAACKGVLLNFEDVHGKMWRFRYSYWNSSQSYVLTKGWSRFVKEKCLKSGDIVTFHRSVGPERQLCIDWKPRAAAIISGTSTGHLAIGSYPYLFHQRRRQHQDHHQFKMPVITAAPVAKEIRLFGVNITKTTPTPACNGGGGSGGGGWRQEERKRELGVTLPAAQLWKRRCLGAL